MLKGMMTGCALAVACVSAPVPAEAAVFFQSSGVISSTYATFFYGEGGGVLLSAPRGKYTYHVRTSSPVDVHIQGFWAYFESQSDPDTLELLGGTAEENLDEGTVFGSVKKIRYTEYYRGYETTDYFFLEGYSNIFRFEEWDVPGAISINLLGSDPVQYSLTIFRAVPEPATWAMLIVGFGAVGVAARRRRQDTAMA